MSLKFFASWKAALATSLVALLGGYLYAGATGLVGIALSLVGGAGYMIIGWFGVRAFGESMKKDDSDLATTMATMSMLIKFPVLSACWWAALQLKHPGHSCFLVGLGLVYCWLSAWSIYATK
ncbi:MAG: hypothetical protein ACOYON_12915 [Fimbriimonas sp.]